MQPINYKTNDNYTSRQLKLPLVIEKLIDISDPVYTFCDVMDHIDLTPYFVDGKGYKIGRPRCRFTNFHSLKRQPQPEGERGWQTFQ
mgnify:CR=1 FL=1